MNSVLQKLVNSSIGFQGNPFPFCAKLKLLHSCCTVVPSEKSLQKTFMDRLVIKILWEEEGGARENTHFK